MNCEQFNEVLEEYADASLAPGDQAAARAHAQDCAACAEAARRREALAHSIHFSLQRETQKLSLRPETRRNIAAALNPNEVTPTVWENLRAILRRPALAVAVVVAAGLALWGSRFYSLPQKNAALPPGIVDGGETCVIDVPFQTETHVSRMENNMAVDQVVYGDGVLSASFSETSKKPSSTKPRSENRAAAKT